MFTILSICCTVIQFVIFLFVVVSIPADILRSKVPNDWLGTYRTCLSFWGSKRCGPFAHNPLGADNDGYPTAAIHDIVKAAAAFDIISIPTTLITAVLHVLFVCKYVNVILPIIMSVVNVVFLIICIGCLLGAWYRRIPLTTIRVKDAFNLDYGVGLIVTAWCLQVISLVIMCITAACAPAPEKEDDKAPKPDEKEPEEGRRPDDDSH